MSAMDRYRDNAKVQKQACWVIITLAVDDGISSTIVENGVLPALANALFYHRLLIRSESFSVLLDFYSCDARIQMYGCLAFSNLSAAGENIKCRIRKAGVTEVQF